MAADLGVCDYYKSLFFARTDIYSHWTPVGWRPVREEVTPDDIYAGLTKTGPSLSGYLPNPESATHVAALDIDLEDGLALAAKTAATMWEAGVSAYVEGSRRGAHLWYVVDRQLSAKTHRRAIRYYLQEAGVAEDPRIEVRPATDQLADAESIGHALRLPMMPHPKTGQQFPLTRPDGSVLGKTISAALVEFEVTPADLIVKASEAFAPIINARALAAQYHAPTAPYGEDHESAAELLRQLWGVQNAWPGRAVRCPAHDDRAPSLYIFPDDNRVLCHSAVCLLNNNGKGFGTRQLRKYAPNDEA